MNQNGEINAIASILKGACLLLVGLTLLDASAQNEWDLDPVQGASSKAHDVVLGSNGKNMVLLRQPIGTEGVGVRSQTFVAVMEGDPHSVLPPKSVALVPDQHEAWTSLGRLVHVDIDPSAGMAVISAELGGRQSVWFSAMMKDGVWSSPWPIPAFNAKGGEAIFAMFDVRMGREGDVLCGFKPNRDSAGTQEGWRGEWKGGYDIVRVPRRGGYKEVWFLEGINTTADEWALAPHPVCGGWLSAERLMGMGGIDAWWCPVVPLDDSTRAKPGVFLTGHTLTVMCGNEPVSGLEWAVQDAKTGMALAKLSTGENGVASLAVLRRDGDFLWTAKTAPECLRAVAVWKDETGRILQRFALSGKSWSLTMLAAMAIGTWSVEPVDRSSLPHLAPVQLRNVAADWMVFHAVGSPLLSPADLRLLKVWAREWMSMGNAQKHVLVMGHASPDGDPEANRLLADERARQVAAQLEFSGLTPDQIRVEGWGSDRPLLDCPSGVNCPSDVQERSRRTELYLLSD